MATKYLARPDSKTVGFIGSGVQARTVLSALEAVFDDLVVVAADSSNEAAEHFATETGGTVGDLAGHREAGETEILEALSYRASSPGVFES